MKRIGWILLILTLASLACTTLTGGGNDAAVSSGGEGSSAPNGGVQADNNANEPGDDAANAPDDEPAPDTAGPMDPGALAEDIRELFALNPGHGRALIEGFLEERFKDLTPDGRVEAMSQLIRRFRPQGEAPPPGVGVGAEAPILSRLFSLILGEAVAPADLSSAEVLDRLATSLNIVFDSLNQLVSVIEGVLYGGDGTGVTTIRHVIGSHLQGEEDAVPLEAYIERIKTAFLDSQKSFHAAAASQVDALLSELDPGQIAEAAGGVKFGPFQKAEMFRRYEERFERCRKWFDSGRFKLDLQRAFEKNCEALSKKQGGLT